MADIERTDSGVGSETSKCSKASVELRRAASKSSDSSVSSARGLYGTGEQNCQDCDLELPPASDEDVSAGLGQNTPTSEFPCDM